MRLKQFFSKPFYFMLFSAYPVLALLSFNISQVHYTVGIRPLIVVTLAALAFFLLFRLLYRDWHRAAFAIAILSLLFYSYGHVYGSLSEKWDAPAQLTIWMSSIWSVLTILALVWAALPKARFNKAAIGLNVVSLGLTLVATVQVVWWSLPHPHRVNGDVSAPVQTLQIPEGETPPDIYYIIMDSYGRADTLQAAYGYDNSDFVNSLDQMGFYVEECSQSNYARTDFSLASSLNMNYVPDLNPDFTPELRDPHPIWELLQYSAVRKMLENAGYSTIAFATGFDWSQLEDADVYLEPPPLSSDMTAFEAMLLQTTPARHLTDLGLLNLDEIAGMRYRERTLFTLDELAQLGSMPGPKFVFAHIIAPHPPFVFGVNGEKIDPAEYLSPTGSYTAKDYRRGYLQVIPFINSELKRVLPQIIAKSAVPPIIILQGDHGAWALSYPQRIQILNAYYMPGHTAALYPSISPVNSFRVVFNSYFLQAYPLLEDKSYSAPKYEIYDFSPVPYKCNP
jgi:hypothetical protein